MNIFSKIFLLIIFLSAFDIKAEPPKNDKSWASYIFSPFAGIRKFLKKVEDHGAGKAAQDQLEVQNRIAEALANNPGMADCADQLSGIAAASKDANAIMSKGVDIFAIFTGVQLAVLGYNASMGAKKKFFPSEDEKAELELGKNKRFNDLVTLKAKNEFNKCVLQHQDGPKDVDTVPLSCQRTRDLYLLIAEKKFKS